MLLHLLKLIWNKKKQNFLLLLEIFVSFIVLFTFFSWITYYYQNYTRPRGFKYSNVLSLKFTLTKNINNTSTTSQISDSIRYQLLKRTIKSVPGVQEVSFSKANFPYSTSVNMDKYQYKRKKTIFHNFIVEDDYLQVLSASMVAGRWFSKEDDASIYEPVVINKSLKDTLFPKENGIGKIIEKDIVIGVINNIKHQGDFQKEQFDVFKRLTYFENYIDNQLLIKVDAASKEIIEGEIYKALAGMRMLSNIEMEYLSHKKVRRENRILVPMLIFFIIACFLTVNVALGLFGVIWYNINQRKAEFGLRRAIGAKGTSVSIQLIGEAMVLASIALVAGCFFALQLQLLNFFDLPSSTYTIALLLSILFIYLLVILSAVYPGRQAAFILPAVALHED